MSGIDHATLRVSDVAASRAFYDAVLAPLGLGADVAFLLDPDGNIVEAVFHDRGTG
jgi:catechol-2,3-dioxygenase